MARAVGLSLSVLMMVGGVFLALEGLDVIKGSALSGVQYWSNVGSAVAGLGVALSIVILRSKR